jgi:hypothetical protein
VNITNDTSQRYGEPEIAVNPTNPNNIVYFVKTDATTFACEASGNPDCATFIFGQPLGFWTVPGWYNSKAYVTFDRGRTWQQVAFPGRSEGAGGR